MSFPFRRLARSLGILGALGLVCCRAHAAAVFDGSIGPNPAGTTLAGNFEITEADGQLSGTNLFQSLSLFSVAPGESATFSHSSAGVRNIIARVSGLDETRINGAMAVREGVGLAGVPTAAALWLINPNGIVIGDGAFFDTASSFRLSSANEVRFANGESFFSHDVTQASTLSIADPVAFGFLRGDSLAAGVSPGNVRIEINDPGNANAPLFLSDMTLVGTQADPSLAGVEVTGDVVPGFDPTASTGPADSSQIQSFRLRLYAMTGGEVLNIVDPVDFSGAVQGSGILIRQGNFFTTDAGFAVPSALEVAGRRVEVADSYIQSAAVLAGSDITLTAADTLQVQDASIQTATFSGADAGNLSIRAGEVAATDSVIGSQIVAFAGAGDAGNVTIASTVGSLTLDDTSIISFANGASAGGNIVLAAATDMSLSANGFPIILTNSNAAGDAGDVSLNAGGTLTVTGAWSIRSDTTAAGDAGDLSLTATSLSLDGGAATLELSSSTLGSGAAGRINIQASDAASLNNVSAFSASAADGRAGTLVLQGENLTITDSNLFTSTLGNDAAAAPATILLQAGSDIRVLRGSIQSSSADAAPAGEITVNAGADLTLQDVSLQSASLGSGDSGNILLLAGGTQTISGNAALVLTNATGSSDAGNITLRGQTLQLLDNYTIQTTSEGSGNAGTIVMEADSIVLRAGRIESASANAGGGDINLSGSAILLDGNAATGEIVVLIADSFSSDALGNGGSITLGDPNAPADIVVVRGSALTASARQGNGGQINVNAGSFIRDAGSVFLVTSVSGAPGALEINAPEQDVSTAVTALEAPLPDAAALIANVCDQARGERSSLIVVPATEVWQPDDYFSQSSGPSAGMDRPVACR